MYLSDCRDFRLVNWGARFALARQMRKSLNYMVTVGHPHLLDLVGVLLIFALIN